MLLNTSFILFFVTRTRVLNQQDAIDPLNLAVLCWSSFSEKGVWPLCISPTRSRSSESIRDSVINRTGCWQRAAFSARVSRNIRNAHVRSALGPILTSPIPRWLLRCEHVKRNTHIDAPSAPNTIRKYQTAANNGSVKSASEEFTGMAHLLEFLMKPSDEELGTIDNIGEFNEMNPDFMVSK